MTTTDTIRAHHRERRFAMKQQARIDRALESLIRMMDTTWSPDLPEKEREAANKKAKEIIKQARKDPNHPRHDTVIGVDAGRLSFDGMRKGREAQMCEGVKTFAPDVLAFVDSVSGFGRLGLATIIGETGDLANYPTHKHLWSRCGYAPYRNPDCDERALAGSTWRKNLGPRALSKEEWTSKFFFKLERYSFFQQIAENMLKHQLIGKEKSASGKTEPKGYYGQIYCARRDYVDGDPARSDWNGIRKLRDAQRIVMKALLEDLWLAWNKGSAAVEVSRRREISARW